MIDVGFWTERQPSNEFMREAYWEAIRGVEAGDGGPFGAVIVKDGNIVGRGHNRVLSKHDPTCHGEMEAIRDACQTLGSHDLSGCEIYTTGYPCPMCFCAIRWANIGKIYYGCNTTDTEVIGFRDKLFEDSLVEARKELCYEEGRESCLEIYKWFEARKVLY